MNRKAFTLGELVFVILVIWLIVLIILTLTKHLANKTNQQTPPSRFFQPSSQPSITTRPYVEIPR